MSTAPQQRRAMLFVGGLVLEGLPAALGSGADLVVIDGRVVVQEGRCVTVPERDAATRARAHLMMLR